MKVLIKKNKDYSCKNKLQKLILNNLNELDGTLCPDSTSALKLITIAYKDAVNNYKGTSKIPKIESKTMDSSVKIVFVEDVIYISLYAVITDLTNQ